MQPFRIARVPVAEADVASLPSEERRVAENLELSGQRLAEHVAGREAARAALADLLGHAPERFVIGRHDDGAPSPPPDLSGVTLSITHTRTMAAAAAGWVSALGVDLCPIADGPRVRRVAQRFFAAEERALVAGDTDAEWATIWALKEAAAKALRHGLLAGGLRATRLWALSPPHFAWPALKAWVELGDEDVVAVVWR